MSEIRDTRQRAWGWFNYEVVDVFGPQIGADGIAVYMVLARHANQEQASWPAIQTIARKTNLSARQVSRALKKLQDVGLLAAEEQHDESGRQLTNRYILLPIDGALLVLADRDATQSSTGMPHSHGRDATQSSKQDTGNKTKKNKSDQRAPDSPDAIALVLSPPPVVAVPDLFIESHAAPIPATPVRSASPGSAIRPGSPGLPPVQERPKRGRVAATVPVVPCPPRFDLPLGAICPPDLLALAAREKPGILPAVAADEARALWRHAHKHGIQYADPAWDIAYRDWIAKGPPAGKAAPPAILPPTARSVVPAPPSDPAAASAARARFLQQAGAHLQAAP